jgi:RNA polymerase sigma-70 factor (ECF subfamily)
MQERRRTSDEQVRQLVAKGDVEGAATEALRALGPEVFGFLHGVVGSDADAEDIFSATSERLWRSIATFRWHCALRTWVYCIARNEMLRFVEGARRHVAGRVTPSALEEVVATVRSETLSALRTDKRDKLRRLRDELPHEDRALVILRVDRELSWDEIARTFLTDHENSTDDEIVREAARLRKRFQLVKERLAVRAREEGLLRR